MLSMLYKLKQKLLLADGAMGTQLLDRGLPYSPLINITNSKIIQKIHREYAEAGAQIIFTHSFAASPYRLSKEHLQNKFKEINQHAVNNALVAKCDNTYVAGNIGPSGLNSQELKEEIREKLTQSYFDQASLLIAEGVDLLALETFTNWNEINWAVSSCLAAKSNEIPLLVSVSPQNNGCLADGTPLKVWAQELNQKAIEIIGINCFTGPQQLKPLIKDLSAAITKPLALKINAGIPKQEGKKMDLSS